MHLWKMSFSESNSPYFVLFFVGVKQRGTCIPLCQSADCNSGGDDTGYWFRGTPRRRGQRH